MRLWSRPVCHHRQERLAPLDREYAVGGHMRPPPPELIRSFASSRFVQLKELLGYKSRDSI